MQKSSRVLPWQWGAWPFEKVSTYTLTNEDSKKLELCSGGQVPCRAGFPHYGSGLGIHLYQCTSWHSCERLHLASVIFFFMEDSLNAFAHIMMSDLWVHLPTPHWVFSTFGPKNGMTPMLHPPYLPHLVPSEFFLFPHWKQSSKGKVLPM